MDFAKHVFISYAHLDNQPLSPQQQGWVTRFHATFQALLSMRLGQQARIWRDDKLQGNDVFADEIVEQFGQTAMLVSVLTPRYLESEWCTRELREFCERAERGGGLVQDNKSRVFKVVKVPMDSEASLPDSVRDLLGYAFYVIQDGAPLELDAAYGETFAQDYNRRVCKLAWDAAQLLKQLEGAPDGEARPAAASTVYLAECSHDCSPWRERIEGELKRHGCTVLPDRRLPLEDEAECLRLVEGWLAKSCLAIHLVGRTAGPVPDGIGGESIVALQNRLAAERSRATALPRVIWLPEGTQSEQPAQQAFIRALNDDPQAQSGADLLTGSLESFLQAVLGTLERLARAAAAPSPPARSEVTSTRAPATVYLICVDADRKASVPLRRHLRDQGIDVELPAFEGEAATVRETNRRLLADSDAVLLYYGAGDESWKRSVDSELKKCKGLSQRAVPAPEFTFLAEPRTRDKDDLLDMQEPGLLDGLSEPPEQALTGLVDVLRADPSRQ